MVAVELNLERLAEFCHRHGIARLSLFGSRARDTYRSDSDLDLLVEFPAGKKVSLFDIGGMIMELREMTGLDVDLRSPQDLSPMFRDAVLKEAKVLYAV